MKKHTPLHWWLDDDGFIAAGSGDTYVTIADPHCTVDLDIDEREANAILISKAPELLDLVQFFVDNFGQPRCLENRDKYQEAVRLLNELKGETK